jgi:2-oxoglutarate dehydrogenase E2 component (dihydrolipoamide succinyltransferase)
MQMEIKVPSVGESITEVEIGEWLKKPGERIAKDENLVVIETEKTTLELPAPTSGSVAKILKNKGETAAIGEVIGYLDDSAAPDKGVASEEPKKPEAKAQPSGVASTTPLSPEPASKVMPAAARLMAETGVRLEDVQQSGPGGRVLKEDVLKKVESLQKEKSQPARGTQEPATPVSNESSGIEVPTTFRHEETVPMNRLRKTVAERLVQAQHNAALLTTFNEVDMSEVMGLRKEYQESFVQKYSVKLGFMSFFVKAAVDALRLIPAVNAEIRGTDIVYRNFYDIGVAVGGGRGLVVPVLRNAERMSFAQIELAIGDFGKRAKENKLKLEELQGGTFTISNGGVYGSLLSTPIINPPQSGILGMHAIQERPVARKGEVVIRPMMYIALTYDHRVVDGREAVTFLKRIKEVVENPARLFLEV